MLIWQPACKNIQANHFAEIHLAPVCKKSQEPPDKQGNATALGPPAFGGFFVSKESGAVRESWNTRTSSEDVGMKPIETTKFSRQAAADFSQRFPGKGKKKRKKREKRKNLIDSEDAECYSVKAVAQGNSAGGQNARRQSHSKSQRKTCEKRKKAVDTQGQERYTNKAARGANANRQHRESGKREALSGVAV